MKEAIINKNPENALAVNDPSMIFRFKLLSHVIPSLQKPSATTTEEDNGKNTIRFVLALWNHLTAIYFVSAYYYVGIVPCWRPIELTIRQTGISFHCKKLETTLQLQTCLCYFCHDIMV